MRNRHAFKFNLGAPILLALVLVGCSEPEVTEPVIRPVRSMIVGDAAQITGRQFPGMARAAQELEVSFRVSLRRSCGAMEDKQVSKFKVHHIITSFFRFTT